MSDHPIHCTAIGLMSGSSLDGLDAVAVEFTLDANSANYKVVSARTFDYPDRLQNRLASSMDLSAHDLMMLDADLGTFMGEKAKLIAEECKGRITLVASHGHTVFHQPQLKLTTQIGSPAHIAAACQMPVVADFRSQDVARGGQGAPLVPIGDQMLFGGFDYCLNLGGIANLSYKEGERRMAFDISPANMALNFLAEKLGKKYDRGGEIAASGEVSDSLLAELEQLEFYQQPAPRSLGREWFEKFFMPVLEHSHISVEDKLATVSEHIAIRVGECLTGHNKRCLITGGGAFNTNLIDRMSGISEAELIIPEKEVVEFKEAIIFALLGVLRWTERNNVLSSVTGADSDHCAGAIYLHA
ncbi:anhydro-N-acetylmuramic acid kinase [Halocola ammonii]